MAVILDNVKKYTGNGDIPASGDPIADILAQSNAGNTQIANNLSQKYFGQPYALNIIKGYQNMYGRTPTQAEITEAMPAFMQQGGYGEAFIAQKYNAEQNSPAKLAEKQQAEWAAKAPGQYGTIDSLFNQVLGRAATDAEKSHFGTALASGQVDQYTLGQWLQNLPEAVQQQDKKFREGLAGDLQKQDQQYYAEQVMPSIAADYAKRGRSMDSSAYQNALALAAQQQNRQRETFLSNLTAQQYEGNKGNAYNAYQNSYGDYANALKANTNYQLGMNDAYSKRAMELQDYNAQQTAYENYLRRYGKRSNSSGIGSLVGGALGLGISAALPGPWSPALASAGFGIGSSLGGGTGSFFG